jgi:hypothetical protein
MINERYVCTMQMSYGQKAIEITIQSWLSYTILYDLTLALPLVRSVLATFMAL